MLDPTRLRVAGSVLTIVGALAAGIGSTLTWTTVGLRVDTQGVLDLESEGSTSSEAPWTRRSEPRAVEP